MKPAPTSTIAILVVALVVLASPLVAFGDDGAALFKTKCAACHGADGGGQTTMGKANKLRDLGSADVQKLADDELATIVSSGRNKMPPYGKSLKPEQVKDLVAFVRTLKK
jgi:mono/diheme cytochrome c family protein